MTTVYEIGPFRLDPAARVLTCADAPTPLGPRGVAVLTVLLERAHEFVAKQDILDVAWPGLVVEENNLAVQISAIRRVLAQAPNGDGWIETLARRGYRFSGPVTVVASHPARLQDSDQSAPGEAHEWERRQLAGLQARLLASPSADLARFLSELAVVIRSFGGQVQTSMATGLGAVFGLDPVDNAPQHAALAALAIHEMVARAHAGADERVDVVVAIGGDHHLVRSRGGRFEIAEEGMAAMLTGLEELVAVDLPGATLATAAVIPFLRRRFVMDNLPDGSRTAWMLRPGEPVSANWTPFAGRSSELAALVAASVLASQGEVQVVGVVGEAGAGKSRLVHEVVGQLQGWLVLEGACAPYSIKTSYMPLAQMLKSYCGVQDADDADAVRHKVSASWPPAAGDVALHAPAFFDLLGVLPPDHPLRSVDPAVRRRRTHDALRQLILAVSVVRPLCLIVEDMQWVDSASREVLDGLVNGAAQVRLLLVAAYRPECQHTWGHKSCYRQVHLGALPVQNAGEMLDALFGLDPGLAPLKQRLAARGNPFYLEETLRDLVETQTLQGLRGDYRLARPVDALEVPATVQAILAARVDRLAPEERRLLQVASTIGRNVPLALLLAIADLPEEPLRRGLETLEAAEFIGQTGLYPNLTYTFRHALTHEATYDSVPQDRCRALHARIVNAIKQAYPDRLTEQVESLAHHATRGEMWEAAVCYLDQAGVKAMESSANLEAADFLDQALLALGKCPQRRETLERAVDLRFDLKAALIPLGAFERILACLRDAEAVISKLDDPRRLGQLNVHMCQMLNLTGKPVEAQAFGENGKRLADSLGDLTMQVTGALFLGIACFSTLDYGRSEPLFLQVLQLVGGERQRDRFGLSGYPAVSARAYLTRIASDQGRFEQGIRFGQESVDLAESLNHPYSQCVAYWILADLYVCKGELQQAVVLLERALGVSRHWQQHLFVASHSGNLGHAYALLGRVNEGLPLMEEALHSFEAMGHGFALSLFLVPLGEAYLLGGRLEDALSTARRALTLARQWGQRGGEAGALRLLGEIAAGGDCSQDAQQHYRDALALATELGLRPLAAHCHIGLGRLHRRLGQHGDSDRHFATGTAMYRAMDMNLWLDLADTTDDRVRALTR